MFRELKRLQKKKKLGVQGKMEIWAHGSEVQHVSVFGNQCFKRCNLLSTDIFALVFTRQEEGEATRAAGRDGAKTVFKT